MGTGLDGFRVNAVGVPQSQYFFWVRSPSGFEQFLVKLFYEYDIDRQDAEVNSHIRDSGSWFSAALVIIVFGGLGLVWKYLPYGKALIIALVLVIWVLLGDDKEKRA